MSRQNLRNISDEVKPQLVELKIDDKSINARKLVVAISDNDPYKYVAAAYGKFIVLCDFEGNYKKQINLPDLGSNNQISQIAIVSNGEYIIASSLAKFFLICSVTTCLVERQISCNSQEVSSFAVTNDGNFIITKNNCINLESGEKFSHSEYPEPYFGDFCFPYNLTFSVHNDLIVSTNGVYLKCNPGISSSAAKNFYSMAGTNPPPFQMKMLALELEMAKRVPMFYAVRSIVVGRRYNDIMRDLSYYTRHKYHYNPNIKLFEVERPLLLGQQSKKKVSCIAISSDSKWIAAGGEENNVRIWDTETPSLEPARQCFAAGSGSIACMTFSPDSRFVIAGTCSQLASIYVWEIKTGDVHRELKGHVGSVQSIAISADSKYLVSGSAEEKPLVLIWDFFKMTAPDKKNNGPIKNNNDLLLEIFLKLISDPDQEIPTHLLAAMFTKVDNLEIFKLPFTLVCIELQRSRTYENALKQHVYDCLAKLATNCLESDFVQYKIALKVICAKNLFSERQSMILEQTAQLSVVFNHPRFIALEEDIKDLRNKVRLAEHKAEIALENIKSLKRALKEREKRRVILSIVKIAVGFLAAPFVDLIAPIFDLSDIAALGEKITGTTSEGWHKLVEAGKDAVKDHMGEGIITGIRGLGYHPDALIQAWVETSRQELTGWSAGQKGLSSSTLAMGPAGNLSVPPGGPLNSSVGVHPVPPSPSSTPASNSISNTSASLFHVSGNQPSVQSINNGANLSAHFNT